MVCPKHLLAFEPNSVGEPVFSSPAPLAAGSHWFILLAEGREELSSRLAPFRAGVCLVFFFFSALPGCCEGSVDHSP